MTNVTEQTPAGAGQQISREELLGRLEQLVPVLAERAEKTEEARQLLDETVRDFHDIGAWPMVRPSRVGGHELDYGILVEAGAVAGRGCASSAWNLTNLACHDWMLGMYPKQAQDDVWDRSLDSLICASVIFPAGRARRTDGGYVLSGRWPFCSGIGPSDWCMLGGIIAGDAEDRPPEYGLFLVHKSDYEVIDVWHTAGLSGTGSNDVRIEEAFVPEHRMLLADDMKGGATPGSEVNPAPLFKVPVIAPFPYILSGTALGAAEVAVSGFVGNLKTKVGNYTGAKLADLQNIQIKVGETSAMAEAARRIMLEDCREAMEIAATGQAPDLHTKARWRRNGAYSVDLCVQAVDKVFSAGGGGSIYNRNPLQRYFRDVHAVAGHIAFSMDFAGATYGRVALTGDTDNATL